MSPNLFAFIYLLLSNPSRFELKEEISGNCPADRLEHEKAIFLLPYCSLKRFSSFLTRLVTITNLFSRVPLILQRFKKLKISSVICESFSFIINLLGQIGSWEWTDVCGFRWQNPGFLTRFIILHFFYNVVLKLNHLSFTVPFSILNNNQSSSNNTCFLLIKLRL